MIPQFTLPAVAMLAGLITSSVARAADSAGNEDFAYEPAPPGGYVLPIVKAAADGALLDSNNTPVRLSRLTRGRITVMSFIYTRCSAAKACPYATGVLLDLHERSATDPELAESLRLVSLSFDPINDTPRRMAEFAAIAAEHPMGAPWHFVTTRSPGELAPILRAYGQALDQKRNVSDPTGPLNHTLRVFLIDAAGRIRNIYSSGTLDPRLVLADIRTLKQEAAALTAADAVDYAGQTVTVAMRVESAARVTDITNPTERHPFELLLLDARNGDEPLTPTERSGIIVRLPATTLDAFAARSLEDLARRFEGKSLAVTGRIEVEPHPARSQPDGRPRLRPVLTVTDPRQIQCVP